MNDRNGRFDTTCTGKSNNVRHVNTVNSAQFVIEKVPPCTRISLRCVNFSLCSSLTRQLKREETQTATTQANITENRWLGLFSFTFSP